MAKALALFSTLASTFTLVVAVAVAVSVSVVVVVVVSVVAVLVLVLPGYRRALVYRALRDFYLTTALFFPTWGRARSRGILFFH